jgi:hypothetical protein
MLVKIIVYLHQMLNVLYIPLMVIHVKNVSLDIPYHQPTNVSLPLQFQTVKFQMEIYVQNVLSIINFHQSVLVF